MYLRGKEGVNLSRVDHTWPVYGVPIFVLFVG